MLFNSLPFGVFLALVLALYYGPVRGARARKLLLVVSSYLFYASWNPPFALLLLFSTLLDYAIGRRLEHAEGTAQRRALLGVSLLGNLGVLGFFKYGDFIAANWLWLDTGLAPGTQTPVFDLIVPVGISFYTFQTLSYSFDVYRRQQPATHSLLDFACYVSFFPQLVAGPIVRSGVLLPQLRALPKATSADAEYGLMRLGTGLAKKVVFADALASYVDPVFAAPEHFSGLNLWLAMYAYAYQIYFDFSGYTDMAIGLARLFGLRVPENFDRPYLAASPREFWQRWHITLSTWLRDYVYIAFGGNRVGAFRSYANLGLTMLLGGLWHGAAWTFVLWDAYHGAWLSLHRWIARSPAREPRTPRVVRQVATFHLVCFGWVLFRAPTLTDAVAFFSGMATLEFALSGEALAALVLLAIAAMIHVTAPPDGWRRSWVGAPGWVQGLGYAAIATAVFLLAPGSKPFIYFQF